MKVRPTQHLIGLWCLFLLLFCWNGCTNPSPHLDLLETIQKRGYVLIGVNDGAPPFGFMERNGQLKGYEIDLAHELAKRLLGRQDAVRFVRVNPATRVVSLNGKQVDFILASMTITPERQKVVNFTQPYYHAAQGVLVSVDSLIQTPSDLTEKEIACVMGGTSEANIRRLYPKAKILGFRSHAEAFTAFYAGRGDALTMDDAVLYGFLHRHCHLRLLPQKLSKEPWGIAFRKDSASGPLQEKVQVILNTLEASGFFKTLDQKWNQRTPPAHCDKAA